MSVRFSATSGPTVFREPLIKQPRSRARRMSVRLVKQLAVVIL